jgi:hypothetical protein
MRSLDGLFAEVSAAFQFPYYFGENYAAFSECLGDLSWIKDSRVIMVITRFEEVLADEPIEMPAFGGALRDAVGQYSKPEPTIDKPVRSGFFIILNSKLGVKSVPKEFTEAIGLPEKLSGQIEF